MRSALLLTALVLVACARGDVAEDSAMAAADDESAMLTAADLSGMWNGMTMPMDGDSVTARWSFHQADATMGHFMLEGSPDTVIYHSTFDGDSVVAVSEPYSSPDMPGTELTYRSVGRMENGMLQGTVAIRLASNPDSVVERARWQASRAP